MSENMTEVPVSISAIIPTIGISGSGKSTWARKFCAEDPAKRIRVNRDDLRAMMFGTAADYSPEQEKAVTDSQEAQVEALLSLGKMVVIDNTNLHPLDMKHWNELGAKFGVPVLPKRFAVSIEEAKANVAKRTSEGGLNVPDFVIEDQAKKLAKLSV